MLSKTHKKLIIFLLATALITTGLTRWLLGTENGQLLGSAALAIAVATSLTQLGAIWYFLASLKTFKKGLKIAYYVLALGILSFSIIQLQLLTPAFFLFSDDLFILNLQIIIPYVLSALLFYVSMYIFAHLLGVRHFWTNVWFVLILSLAAVGVFVVLPRPDIGVDQSTLNMIMGGIAWCGVVSIAATLVAWQIRKAIGAVYKTAMTWVSVALGTVAFAAFHELFTKIYFATLGYVETSLSLWPFALVGVLLLKAGLAFKETGRQFPQLPAQASYIDVVVGVAGMLSNPAAIDKELDQLRAITAKQDSQQPLSASDKSSLLKLYLYIEDYLLTKEPLQKFTPEGLRSGLPEYFLRDMASYQKAKQTGSIA